MNRSLVDTDPKKVLSEIRSKVQAVMAEVQAVALERETEVLAFMCALASRTDGAIVGSAGIAKSMMLRAIMRHITGAGAYITTLGADTRPRDLFCKSVGVKKTPTADGGETVEFVPVLGGKAGSPDVFVTYFDEFGQASPATQEAIRSLLSDREVDVMGVRFDASHQWCTFISTNELPDGPLGARLVLKLEATPVQQESNMILMAQNSWRRKGELRKQLRQGKSGKSIPQNTISREEMEILQDLVYSVEIPRSVLESMIKIRQELKTEGIEIDDRRFVRIQQLVAAHAVIVGGRLTAGVEDLVMMQHSWQTPDEYPKFREKVFQFANPLAAEANKLADTAVIVVKNAVDSKDPRNGRAAMGKLKELFPQIQELIKKASEQGLPNSDVKAAQDRIKSEQARLARELFDMDM